MNSGLQGNNRFRPARLIKSFGYAFSGIAGAVRKERNIQIHISISIIVVILSIATSISRMEWLFVLMAIGGMLSLELVNTAVERTVDLVTKDFHPLAKQAKDIAAGAVLIYAVLSVLIGLIIFIPKVMKWFI
ncbi:diacylglycerol kinase family protein [Bacillus sp. EB01]|uniref:diacylglycerol kinase family protein n=1 Tax=Bacillus sp. EB01 TaxID=1347086 RepID=UPI0005C5412E|nr:diacylglycerol kinase family protein [Bacillus sp. EB01]